MPSNARPRRRLRAFSRPASRARSCDASIPRPAAAAGRVVLWLPLGWRVGDRPKIRYSHRPSCCRSPSRRRRLSLCRSLRSRRRRLRGLSPPLVRRRRITLFCRWFTMSSNGKGLGKVKTPLFVASGVRGSELPKPVRSGPSPIFFFQRDNIVVLRVTLYSQVKPTYCQMHRFAVHCPWPHPRSCSDLGMDLKSLHT